MAELKYADIFSNHIVDLYTQELKSMDLYNSNPDIQIINGKQVKLPKLTVSGYKDHNRAVMGFNTGTYANDYEIKVLDHDRDVEFAIDPMDVDETNLVVSVANIQKRFEITQAIPEKDKYTFSKLFAEATAMGSTIKTTALTSVNVLDDFDDNLVALEEAGVPLDRVILYCTPTFMKLLKETDKLKRSLANADANVDRRVRTLDDIKRILTVPSDRFKTAYNFTDGCVPAVGAKQINYIMIAPEKHQNRKLWICLNRYLKLIL
ncbi:MAG: capsid protein [Clostridiales bacterium]